MDKESEFKAAILSFAEQVISPSREKETSIKCLSEKITTLEKIRDAALQMISDMIILRKDIALSDVPFELRVCGIEIYAAAFRVDRDVSDERLINDFELLFNDICDERTDSCMRKLLVEFWVGNVSLLRRES